MEFARKKFKNRTKKAASVSNEQLRENILRIEQLIFEAKEKNKIEQPTK